MATVKQLPSCMATQLSNSKIKIVKLYACTGFIVRVIMMDQEFNKVKEACDMVEINTTAARKHVGEIEWFIRTIKESSRALVSDLPYNILPRQITIHLVYFAVLWLNSLPAAAGVSKKYSPREIVLSRKLNFDKHCKATFSSYVEAHKDPTITNTMRSRTFPGIFLGPTGNRQGTHKVFDINTGVVKKPRIITPLPMPDRVIAMVKDWGRRHQKEDKKQALTFLNQKKNSSTGTTTTSKTTRVSSNLISLTLTSPPNSPISTSNQNNPTTTKLSKSLKKATTNVFMLRNVMHPLMISLAGLQECPPRLMRFK